MTDRPCKCCHYSVTTERRSYPSIFARTKRDALAQFAQFVAGLRAQLSPADMQHVAPWLANPRPIFRQCPECCDHL